MNSYTLLGLYSVGILAAAVLGVWGQSAIRLTHTRVQLAMSFVAGLMIGVAMYHLLPHGFERISGQRPIEVAGGWMLGGMMLMVLLLRGFPPHQQDPVDRQPASYGRTVDSRSLNWLGIAMGLGLHGLTEGTALGAAVLSHEGGAASVVSLGIFLATALHKPIEAFFLLGVMRVSGLGQRPAWLVSLAVALICPLGALATLLGIGMLAASVDEAIGRALAFGAGALVCIALSDLLPEIHFHRHDRLKLTVALILGLALAYVLVLLERPPQ